VIRYIQETICPESATITDGIKNLRKVLRYQKGNQTPKGKSKAVNRRWIDNTMTKRTNNDLHSITQINKDRATQIPLKPGVNSGAPEGLIVPAPTCDSSCYCQTKQTSSDVELVLDNYIRK
jgi:hypothetical protein